MNTLAIIIERDTLSAHEARLVAMIDGVWSIRFLKAEKQDLVERRTCGRFYRFILAAETWLTGLFVSRIKEHRRRVPAQGITPLRSAQNEDFDLVLNLTRGPIKRNLHPRARRGVLDLKYGNVRTGIEGPPGFWESCHEDNATGCWLTLDAAYPEVQDAPKCVFSARYKTKRTMCLNAESVQREGHIDIAHELLRLASGADFRNIDLPTEPVWTCPGPFDVIWYRLRTIWREVRFFLPSRLLGRDLVFAIGITDQHWSKADLSQARIIPNPKGSYLADPFIVERDGCTVIFAEEFDFNSQRGRISWLDQAEEGPEYCGTLIEEPYHMSFPFPFEYKGELYMVPETFESREISLYRCSKFPDQWERFGTLMDDVEASDTMVFRHNGRWWILTNLRPEGALDFYSRLCLFWSNDPTSKSWTPHPLNPILIDAEGGRNGGLLRDANGAIHRVGQIQSIMTYGAGWSINKVMSLSEKDYAETCVASAPPMSKGPIVGGHHVHGTPSCTVLDVLFSG